MFQKTSRTKSEKNLDIVRNKPCAACNKGPPSDPDHIQTKGAGGGDNLNNLWPLCRKHHTERHQYGLKKMLELYPNLERVLILINNEKYY